MEPRTEHAVIAAAAAGEQIVQEQGIELDHVLPDYYPDVCKLVGCFVEPAVVSRSVTGGRLSYELRVQVRILYCGEESSLVQCVTQNLLFSRSAELPAECGEEAVEISPDVDYVNCRAVSRRRLDVRGAVTICIGTHAVMRQEVLSDVFGRGMQLRKIPVQYQTEQLFAAQSILLNEELPLGAAQPAVLHIVRCEAHPVELSYKLVSGKVNVQGSLRLQILYAHEAGGESGLEPLSFTLPFSQLIDMEGVGEQDVIRVNCMAVTCDLKNAADPEGEVRSLRCEAELRVECRAVRTGAVQLVCDAYSTEHPCSCETREIVTCAAPVPFAETEICTAKLLSEEEPACVYDAWCSVKRLSHAVEGNTAVLTGMLCYALLVQEKGGMPRLLEREEPFEHRFTPEGLGADDRVQPERVLAENCTYTLGSGGEITVRAELRLTGTVTHCRRMEVLSSVAVDEETGHPRDYALKLYYGKPGEPVWDIAKRCHTSVDAVMDENDLASDVLQDEGMLLIPIVY